MNYYSLISITLLFLGFSGRPVPAASNQSIIPVALHATTTNNSAEDFLPWGSQEKLQWDDFLCEPQKGTDAVASTSTSLGISYQVEDGHLNYHITCNFSKKKSWGLMKTDYILAHEQGHFDITEIFARKLNQELTNYHFNRKTFRKDVNEIYQSIVAQKEEFQKLYDGESDHSRNKRVQYEWLDKIDAMLVETAPYATYP